MEYSLASATSPYTAATTPVGTASAAHASPRRVHSNSWEATSVSDVNRTAMSVELRGLASSHCLVAAAAAVSVISSGIGGRVAGGRTNTNVTSTAEAFQC